MNATVVQQISDRPLRERVGGEEWNTRVELAAAYRLADMYGWATTLIYNHISARLPAENGEERFLLNPFGLRYDEVTASNLVKIDLEGNVHDGSAHEINEAGYVIHSAIHAARPEVNCVIHTHTEVGMAVSCLEEGLMFVNQDALMFYGNVGYHEFEGIACDLEERQRLVADLGGNFALVLRNHGLLTVGRTIGEAFTLMFFLEKVCNAQIKLMSAGGRVRPLTEEVRRRTAGQFDLAAEPMGRREWPALVRQLDAADGSYRS